MSEANVQSLRYGQNNFYPPPASSSLYAPAPSAIAPGIAPPTPQLYYREGSGVSTAPAGSYGGPDPDGIMMNSTAGRPHPLPHYAQQPYPPYTDAPTATPRTPYQGGGPPSAGMPWPQQPMPVAGIPPTAPAPHEVQPNGNGVSYPPSTPAAAAAAWDGPRPPPPYRPQHQDPNFAHPHNMASHQYNSPYSSRPPHHPVEPNAAPSPPTQYPSSPRTPLSASQAVNSPAIPALQRHQESRPPLSIPTSAHPDPGPTHPLSGDRSSFSESNHVSPSMQSPLPPGHMRHHHGGRNSVVQPLGPPTPVTSGFPGNQGHRGSGSSYTSRHESFSGPAPSREPRHSLGGEVDERKPLLRRESAPASHHANGHHAHHGHRPKPHRQSHVSYDTPTDEEEADVKTEPKSRTASASISPTTVRSTLVKTEGDSPAKAGPKSPKQEPAPKKKGQPVFCDRNGTEYYENDRVPPEAEALVPPTYQIGTGKHTKGLLLPKIKDGIAVNPEWGFTAGGKARQRLPQACKNCRAKKIRCMESDYDESMCQHCVKMRITCQREDEKKTKKSRTNQSHEHDRPRKPSDRHSSTSSVSHSHSRSNDINGSAKKRKSSDEGQDRSRKAMRKNGSRNPSHEPIDIKGSYPPVHTQNSMWAVRAQTSPYPLKMENEELSPGVPRERATQLLRENHAPPDGGTPQSYTSASPTTSSVSIAPPAASYGHQSIVQRYTSRAPSVSTPRTAMGTPSFTKAAIMRNIGEDPRHSHLPSPEVLQHLTNVYFRYVYSQTYAFLHRETFIEDMDKHSPVLLFSLCAVAARFSNQLEPQLEEQFAQHTRELIKENCFNYSLELVQAMVHMGLHDFGSNNGHKAWIFAGMAVRMGAALNLNLEAGKKEKDKSFVEKEVARRTYWCYYLMDRFNSYGVARPYLTQDHDCHIQLPCNQPSFTNRQYVITEHLLGPNPYHPRAGTQFMGAMAYLVRIVGIWGNILRQIHLSGFQTLPQKDAGTSRSRLNKAGKEFEAFIDQLENWRKTLPPGLEYSNENLAGQIKVGTTGAFVMMHVMWHTAMAYVHRYVRTVGIVKDQLKSEELSKTFVVESIRKAFVHADAVLQIMGHVRKRQEEADANGQEPVVVNAPFLGQAISDACNITVIRALEIRGEPGGARDQKARVYIGLDWLRELKRYWKPLEGIWRKLRKQVRQLDKTMSQPPSARKANFVPTPESSNGAMDAPLIQPGHAYPVDPNQFTAQPSDFAVGPGDVLMQDAYNMNTDFPHFQDYLAPGVLPYDMYAEAFNSDWANHGLAEIAGVESAFPELYRDTTIETIPTTLGPAISSPYEASVPPYANAPAPSTSTPFLQPADEDEDDPSTSEPEEAEKDRINTTYFDSDAVRDGRIPDPMPSNIGKQECAPQRDNNNGNPMDLMNLLANHSGMVANVLNSTGAGVKPQDEFTYKGGDGEAAPPDLAQRGPVVLDNDMMEVAGGAAAGGGEDSRAQG